MSQNRSDRISKLFADRRLTRIRVIATSVGVAAKLTTSPAQGPGPDSGLVPATPM